MNKKDLKKAALLGLAIGALTTASSVSALEPVTGQGMILAHSCGGGCGSKARGGNIAAEDEPILQNRNHSCGASARPMPQGTNQTMPQGTQPQHSCGASARPVPAPQYTQHGCGAQAVPQGTQQPQHSCGASYRTNPNMPRSNGY